MKVLHRDYNGDAALKALLEDKQGATKKVRQSNEGRTGAPLPSKKIFGSSALPSSRILLRNLSSISLRFRRRRNMVLSEVVFGMDGALFLLQRLSV